MNPNNKNSNILLASAGALLVAAALLVTVILPAEYGWDPLGTGAALGLTAMSGEANGALKNQKDAWKSETKQFHLAPFEAVEYKYRLEAGDALLYQWTSNAEVLFDMHAEPDGAAPGYADSFEKSRGQHSAGNYTAPFTGIHGWFWQNRTQEDIVVTLQTRGFFSAATEFRDGKEFDTTF